MQTTAISEKSKSTSAVAMHKNKQQPFFAPVKIQPKLTIGAVDDPYEREADAMADHVMRLPVQQYTLPNFTENKPSFFSPKPITSLNVQRECASCEKEKLKRKEEKPEEEEKLIHRKEKSFDGGLNQLENSVQRKCAESEKEEKLQLKSVASASAGMEAPSIVHDVINSGGQSLDTGTRNFFEPRFGHDFSKIKIHTGSQASASSRAINAHAYTSGNNIVFNEGKFAPHTDDGRKLLAHELTHVVQQGEDSLLVKIQRSPADELISDNTTLGFLDEEALGQALAAGLPINYDIVNQVLNKVGSTDKDDVSYETAKAAKANSKLQTTSETLRIRFINEMLSGVVSDEEEGMIADIWISFEITLPEVTERHEEEWKKSLWESDQLEEFTTPIRQAFKYDVEFLALTYLSMNKDTLTQEAQQYGINLQDTEHINQSSGYLEAVMAIAPKVMNLKNQMEQLKQIRVGYHEISDCMAGDCLADSYFNPEIRPSRPPNNTESPPWPTWEQTKTQYDRLAAVVSSFASRYPAIYILLQQNELNSFAQLQDSAKAKDLLESAFWKTNEKIDESVNKVNGTDIEYYDLPMIQSQLFSGSANDIIVFTYRWDKLYFGDIAKDELRNHEARQFWVDMGLGLLAAAALIAAPFTGGASAAFLVGFGMGIGTAQAGMSWERYLSLSTLNDSAVSEELSLVSRGQVSAQLIDAIIKTVAVFLDAYGARSATTAAKATRTSVEAAEFELRETMATERIIREAEAARNPLREATDAEIDALVDQIREGGNYRLGNFGKIPTYRIINTGNAQAVSFTRIRWAQPRVNRWAPIYEEMLAGKSASFPPIDVVESEGVFLTLDHTRARMTLETGAETIDAIVHLPNEPLPPEMIGRFGEAQTWGEAFINRAANNKLPPTGTPTPPRL